ncbi:MAG: ribosome biogenesis GTPase YlqF [Eubacterium sp.]|nr:ribosome biogenesis GTPase YlqF [Eubacterium sp.]
MNIQWYPGHMTKAKRQIAEDIKLVDIIIEILDARAPLSSRNPDIVSLGNGKKSVILLGKSDLADPASLKAFEEYFTSKGAFCAAIDSRKKADIKKVRALVDEAAAEKKARDLKRGIKNRPVRVMVAGIPNAGKSTFINTFAGKSVAKTADRPGVTRGKQWIRPGGNIELLDTPGILWPKFDDERVGLCLTATGAIKDAVTDTNEVALFLVDYLKEHYAGALNERYGVDESASLQDMLENIAVNRKFLKSGGESDLDRAALMILEEFREGKLGRMSLEEVPAY